MKAMFENRQLRSCLWIIHILQKYGKLSFRDIQQYWLSDQEISAGVNLPARTFFNYRLTIQDVFGIVIECEKPTNTYYINVEGDKTLSSWLISSFNVGQLVMDSQEVKDRILLEAPPHGMTHFNTIVESFRRHCSLMLKYQKFNGAEPYVCHLKPYCLKLHQQRWYLLAIRDDGTRPITFALDRIQQVELLRDEPFEPEKDFSPQQYYQECFGVWLGEGEAPVITLRVYDGERNYLRTLPLHSSQREVTITEHYSDFQIHCFPTRDLLLHLLSHGKGLEVISPEDFRREVAAEVRALSERYGKMELSD